jgi:HEAT repeat protein
VVEDDRVESSSAKDELSRMSIPALFAAARAEVPEDDPDNPAPHLVALHMRPTREVFDAAAHLLADDDPAARELGARVLRELGPSDDTGHRPFTAEAVPLLVHLLDHENEPRVLGWAISALGYNCAREALNKVLKFVEHPHCRVRFHVAAALPSLVDPDQVELAASEALQRLCRDEDADTRFYALYALVEEVLGAEDAHVNQAVTDRLDDPDESIRSYAREHHVTDH